MKICEQLSSSPKALGDMALCIIQKGVHQLWRIAIIYGRALQKSNAVTDRLCLPLHEEMRVNGTVKSFSGARLEFGKV